MGQACQSRSEPAPPEARERAYRANNQGVALLEQLRYQDAAGAFREALASDPGLAFAHLNLGLALYYAQDPAAAKATAEQAARLLPSAPQPLYVLGLIARAENQPDAARELFDRVRAIDATDVGANINAAQLRLESNAHADAAALLAPVVEAEPFNITAAYVLGLALTRAGETDRGTIMLERAQALRGSGYGVTLGTGYLEQGRYAEALASTGAEPDLVDARPPSVRLVPESIGAASLGTGGGTEPPFGRRFSSADLSDAGIRALATSLGGALVPLDVDSDGDLDLLVASASGQTLLRHDGGNTWVDATVAAGLTAAPTIGVPVAAVSADYDNDGAVDIFVLRAGQSSLYRHDGHGHFVDVSAAAKLPPYPYLPGAAAAADVDHDGDVDLLIGGLADLATTRATMPAGGAVFPHEFAPAPLQLLRNNGNGTFTDVTTEAKLDGRGHTIALVPTDYDNRRDVDVLVVDRVGPPRLLANRRDGSFRDVSELVGLSRAATPEAFTAAATVADVNKDDWPDFFFAQDDGGVFALSNGRGQFIVSPASAAARDARASQFVDYDSDGLLDLLTWTATGPHVLRNLGRQWADVTEQAIGTPNTGRAAADLASARALVVADLDGDGRSDAVTLGAQGLLTWRHQGGETNGTFRVQLRGRVSNRQGVGAKVQVRAGSLSARLEMSSASPAVAPADLVFGLGPRTGVDVARVLWPSGIVQAETAASAASPAASPGNAPAVSPSIAPTRQAFVELPARLAIEELDRKPSSCPLLFTWNGERFEFVTDFLGGGEMGYWEAPGVRNTPDPVEYVRIRGDQLTPRDGRLELRLTNELEESVFFDRVRLLAVDHPREVELFPNEGMTEPAKPFGLHAVTHIRAAAAVTDDRGTDVGALVARTDWRAPDAFALSPIRGYAEPHGLVIDVGAADATSARPNVLLLSGWTDYAFSSDNVAAHQAGLEAMPPHLEIRDTAGRWRPSGIAVGIPVGRPQTIVLDLGDVLRPGEHEVRVTTNMRVYWDHVRVGSAARTTRPTPRPLTLVAATLSARGFSREVRPTPTSPALFEYSHVSATSPWKTLAGHYTREGDVAALLDAGDDFFAITKPGDEVAVTFDATTLRELPEGWTRTYLLQAEGYSKEMDINSASPDGLEPLPFRGMTRYPYGSREGYPDTAAHRRYRETYNTRVVSRTLSPLAAPSAPSTQATPSAARHARLRESSVPR